MGIIGTLLFGFLFPEAGISLNPAGISRTILIVLLFLITGITLPTEVIKRSMQDIRLHLYIQSFVFIITPAYFVLTTFLFNDLFDEQLIIGIFALACLPTTVSTCIVFTQISGGNVVGTMFNTALANMAGIAVSPLLLSVLLQGTGQPLPFEDAVRIFTSLSLKMLIPIIAGQVLRRFFKEMAVKLKPTLSICSNAFILMIVLLTFSKTSSQPDFLETVKGMLVPFIYLVLSFLILVLLAYVGAKLWKFPRENTISVIYAAPQKTLAMGVPLLTTYFAHAPEILGIAILPLLFYHPWQLFISGIIKNFITRKKFVYGKEWATEWI